MPYYTHENSEGESINVGGKIGEKNATQSYILLVK